jgi:hypothetical protein
MYYHCRELKYVEYGKVFPPPKESIISGGMGEEMLRCYTWIGKYCGYCPQIWLSRSNSSITGFKRGWKPKEDPILFGFDLIVGGFPVKYNTWEYIMSSLMNHATFEEQNADIIKFNSELVEDYEKEKWELDGELKEWIDCGKDLDTFLKKCLFVEHDQVVVPSLNLKVAKKILCRNEKQKKALRKMGFIEDRIIIKNITRRRY